MSAIFQIPELFIISRFVISIGTGISFGSLMLFMQETSPTEYRGMTSFMSETAFIATIVIGVGFGMGGVFGKNLPVLTGIALIPAILSILIMIPLKETPKFLLINRQNRKAALESIIFYQGEKNDVESMLDEILLEIEDADEKEPIWHSVITVIKTPVLRLAFIIGCLATQTIVPSWPLLYLSTDILSVHFPEDEAQYISLGFIGANFIAGICGLVIIEKIGRRPLLLTMGSINTLSIIFYVIFDRLAFSEPNFKWGTVASLILFGVTYGVALGPIAFFITSELVVQKYRSVVQSMVFAVNTVVNFTFSFVTLPLFDQFTSISFIFIFVCPSILSLIYLYFKMPETLGREIHEVVEELEMKSGNEKKKRNIVFPKVISSSEIDKNQNYGSKNVEQNDKVSISSSEGTLDKSDDTLFTKLY
ncbi:hypothetical protein WR25_15208 [Diploscapter pachys]|uniref:Major facilitator superfamily (MFS) profile domain-containing protein n=1 Tax=Diploscapter pachys TaxID=2018661 RepID=A0A2A2LUG5_9BILA|nr:hypothetical protein WR25_15208 [Diploscapter pachys]